MAKPVSHPPIGGKHCSIVFFLVILEMNHIILICNQLRSPSKPDFGLRIPQDSAAHAVVPAPRRLCRRLRWHAVRVQRVDAGWNITADETEPVSRFGWPPARDSFISG